MKSLFEIAEKCIAATSVKDKLALTKAGAASWCDGELSLQDDHHVKNISEPGRPAAPELVSPRLVSKRKLHTVEGRAALVHAVTHIEFNAINLAWDAVYRFRDMPKEFYDDWVRVADEEAYHFELLHEHLGSLGFQYGDFSAHDGLWQMAKETADDVMVRMALVPRVLEARGLDVTPGMMQRLQQAGDQRAVEILEIILRDEIGHVEIGSRWYHYLCEQRSLDSNKTFFSLVKKYMKSELKGPFHMDARKEAGFTEQELEVLGHSNREQGVK